MNRTRLSLLLALALAVGCASQSAAPTGWVDRIEGETAVLLVEEPDGRIEQRDIPLALLPPSVREGDRVVDGRLDPEGRRRQAARIRELRLRLFGPPVDTAHRE